MSMTAFLRRRRVILACGTALALMSAGAHAKTLRIGAQADAGTMDPQAQNIQTTLTVLSMIYEPLVARDKALKPAPGLATSWEIVNPTTWRFKLRDGVKFHDGADFGSDDVKFTIERAQSDTSQFKVFVSSIKEVKTPDKTTVEIVTNGPDPLVPDKLTYLLIMDKDWSEKNNVSKPQNLVNKQETYTALNANGTGPFKLASREPDSRTVMERNAAYWDKAMETNVTRIEFRPIGSDPTRMAALVSGELDIVIDVPSQDVARLGRDPNLKVTQTDEFRTLFFGFDLKNDQLKYAPEGTGNPFKDKRVREAVYRAIDVEAISKSVMRGLATPTGQLLAPGNVGYDKSLDQRMPYDPAAAKKLLADAGFPNGISFTFDCPNDRYVNDEGVCKAVAAMLAQAGFNANLNLMPRSRYFPKLWERDTSMFLMGFNSPYFDGMYALETLHMTRKEPEGTFNYSLYSNPEIDAAIRAARDETDLKKREELMKAAWGKVTGERIYIPLYHQVLVWAMRKNVTAPIRPDNWLEVRWVKVD